jgi:GT2 family glycosyltransferase
MGSSPKVHIVILNYNGAQFTLDCVESVLKIDYPNFRVIVVDNASTDDSVERFKEAFADPRIELLVNDKNEGYAGGNNRGMVKGLAAGANYIFILNNDTTVEPGCLTPLVEAMERDAILGIAGCPVFDVPFHDSPLYFWRMSLSMGRATRFGDATRELDLGEFDYVSGAAFLIRADTVKRVGMFDARFFIDWEDVDLCFRVRRAGYKLKIVRSPGARHLASQTAKRFRPLLTFYSLRNRAWVVRRHGAVKHRIVFNLYSFCFLYPRTILGRIRRAEFELLMPTLRGIWEGCFRYPGCYAGSPELTSHSCSSTPS